MVNRFARGDLVRSARFGAGRVELDTGPTVIARFGHGIEECDKAELAAIKAPLTAAVQGDWDAPLEVIARLQAEAIRSVNDAWGVFSRSRVVLLPHQLWVCRRVLERWPTRWLVADDVGLGKTIEAGLILWPLLARGAVRRLLVLCPASLVEQWQYRLRTMFDIRLAQYLPDADGARADFWGTHPRVVASIETLRADHKGRQQRLAEAEPWDLLIVDEAHRLNADEESGPTLNYKLVDRLLKGGRVASVVFFTGTPHRGKDYGFLALLHLLRPDLFHPRRPLVEQLPRLREVLIRNNKQNVTNLEGKKLFKPPIVRSDTYGYSPAEASFYDMLTEFIVTGKAYASSLGQAEGRAVMLVLIAMQKLASSSVAAIRRALRGRLGRIIAGREKLETLQARRDRLMPDPDDDEAMNRLDEEIAQAATELQLMENEEVRLRELVAAAERVDEETKIRRIIELVRTRFAGRAVLFFTEYKATQSLLMSALIRVFGDDCVTFINGDNQADEVLDARGRARTLRVDRAEAAGAFNEGRARFLVSTEAGGEGIDLQERCHSLIHVDLPWNPMRLHQRVGRLNRYGQERQVEVITLRNPETVESRIWDKLNAKIESIMAALGRAMDEPEDLLQLVLGMASPDLFRELFAEAATVAEPSLSDWFDHKTARFGGRDAIATVRDLVGHSARFDFGQVAARLPRLDLPALRPFLIAMLTRNRRRIRDDEHGLAFKTPEDWLTEPSVRTSYEDLTFDRHDRSRDAAQRVLGVGHPAFDQALRQALSWAACATALPSTILDRPLVVFRITDRITGGSGQIQAAVAGVLCGRTADEPADLLADWQLLDRLNGLAPGSASREIPSGKPPATASVSETIERAREAIEGAIPGMELQFQHPATDLLAVIWPC
jgi:superfamily II DNA or RNA helicase